MILLALWRMVRVAGSVAEWRLVALQHITAL